MKSKNVRGYQVNYEENAEKGVDHLNYVLSSNETISLFRNARYSGKIKFEDRGGRNYTLISKTNGTYELEKRRY